MSSKRAIRRKMCDGKRQYSWEEAGHALREANARGVTGLNRYRCQFCRQYHIGHLPRSVLQAMRERRG